MHNNLWRIVLVIAICLGFGAAGFGIGKTARDTLPDEVPDTATQLASQVTVLFPSYLTYAQQITLEKGTGLEGVDFIYVERQTGIDALTLMAIAAHESAWGSNSWSKRSTAWRSPA